MVRDHRAAAPPDGEDRRARPELPPVVGGDAADAAVRGEQGAHAGVLQHLDARLLDDVRGELAQDAPAGGAAARVDDAADRVAALEAEREVAVAVGVEAHAEPLEVGEAGGRLVAEHLGRGAAHEIAAGDQRVVEVLGRRVLDREGGREPALGPVGGGLRQRTGGDRA